MQYCNRKNVASRGQIRDFPHVELGIANLLIVFTFPQFLVIELVCDTSAYFIPLLCFGNPILNIVVEL